MPSKLKSLFVYLVDSSYCFLLRLKFRYLRIGSNSKICSNAWFSKLYNTFVGNNVYIGRSFYSSVPLQIGNKVLIAPHVAIVGSDHPSQTPKGVSIRDSPRPQAMGVVVGEDVWICYGAIIFDGVTIGRGSVIGAGSVVTKSVPEYSVYAGNPARFIKHRISA